MKRPTDPRNHGLTEPLRMIMEHHKIHLPMMPSASFYGGRISISTLNAMLEKALRDHSLIGQGLYGDPYLENGYLHYSVEWDNDDYNEEINRYRASLNEYADALAQWELYEEQQKNRAIVKDTQRLDEQILRAEHRLANLKAVKAGEPLPFPD